MRIAQGISGNSGVITCVIICVFLASSGIVTAGSLDSPGAPGAVSTYTLEDIYSRLNSGTAGIQGVFTEPSAGPTAGTMHTLNDIMGKAPVVDASGASAGDVLAGKTFWGLTSGGWGPRTGTLATQTVKNTTVSQAAGYYSAFNLSTVDPNLSAGNIKSGATIFGVPGSVQQATGTAAAGDVLSGKTFSNSTATGVAGTMPSIGAQSITPGTSAKTITQGYHNGSGTVSGDANLVTGNIKSGVSIFGVSGSSTVVDTVTGTAAAGDMLSGKTAYVNGNQVTGNVTAGADVSGANGSKVITIPNGLYSGSKTATASDTNLAEGNIKKNVNIFGVVGTYESSFVPKTGQTPTVPLNPAIAGSDGALQKGVAWPNPRFTDNSNGTVTDNTTGLIWLKNANCFGLKAWATALTECATLNSGECGLSDGSVEGDWRLPNVRELFSLIDFRWSTPALCNTAGTSQWTAGAPFLAVQSDSYWSSSTYAAITDGAWTVFLLSGVVGYDDKTSTIYVWPVRAGQ